MPTLLDFLEGRKRSTLAEELWEKCGGPGSRRPGPCPGPKKPEPVVQEPAPQPVQPEPVPDNTDRGQSAAVSNVFDPMKPPGFMPKPNIGGEFGEQLYSWNEELGLAFSIWTDPKGKNGLNQFFKSPMASLDNSNVIPSKEFAALTGWMAGAWDIGGPMDITYFTGKIDADGNPDQQYSTNGLTSPKGFSTFEGLIKDRKGVVIGVKVKNPPGVKTPFKTTAGITAVPLKKIANMWGPLAKNIAVPLPKG